MYVEWNAGARGHCRVSGALVLYKNITVYAGVALLAALLSFVCISGDSEAADITVDSLGGNADYTTISAAVSAASNDDVIKVAAREDYVEERGRTV